MPVLLNRESVRKKLENFELKSLFIEDLGWDISTNYFEVNINNKIFVLEAIAQKRGMVAFILKSNFLDYDLRKKIEKKVSEKVYEHIIINTVNNNDCQNWLWVKREIGQPDRLRQTIYKVGQSGENLIQKLEQIAFTFDEEEHLTIADVSGRVRATFDVEKVTKKFFDQFKKERDKFLTKIQGIDSLDDKEWYASIMLNRLMFIYFIQKKSFLDNDYFYLQNRLKKVREKYGSGEFYKFYRVFLLRLFHEGLSIPEKERSIELNQVMGKVPYLNGGIFNKHELEIKNKNIQIPDIAFEDIFIFFNTYQWHLDDRILQNDKEINPDILGYIFERYINQKEMGAFYTKEDITSYISNATIIPSIFDSLLKEYPIAFEEKTILWKNIQENPNRYIQKSIRHGINYDVYNDKEFNQNLELPEIIGKFNNLSDRKFGLPTETWNEVISRRAKYNQILFELKNREIKSIEFFITHNLNLQQLLHDILFLIDGPEIVITVWKILKNITILDPTCGSGAFLFSALNTLEPIYLICIESMEAFVNDERTANTKYQQKLIKDFESILEKINIHQNKNYFILKSIIVNNLFGVDIMEEAVEICKLRLFLKLVSNLDNYDDIEPLPDIDFNIRAGNTLIGFTSIQDIERAMGNDLFKKLTLPKIQEQALQLDIIFKNFQNNQLLDQDNIEKIKKNKNILINQLNELRLILDNYIAEENGINPNNTEQLESWKKSTQPFHWFLEFFSIIKNDGFSVIIGNPPYVEVSKVKKYSLVNFELIKTGNLYSICFERFLNLLKPEKRYGVIVPISSVSTSRMIPLMKYITKKSTIHISNFADRPAKLFTGVDMNLSIILGKIILNQPKNIYSTIYNRWNEEARKFLLTNITYTESKFSEKLEAIPKIGSKNDNVLFNKLLNHPPLANYLLNYEDDNSTILYYHSGGRYFRKCIKEKLSNEYKPLIIKKKHEAFVICLLSSSLFYWLWIVISDCFHVNKSKVYATPVPSTLPNDVSLTVLASKFLKEIENNCEIRKRVRADGSIQTEKNYIIRKSKNLLDQIDQTLAKHYNLSDLEINYLINYDGKYRIDS